MGRSKLAGWEAPHKRGVQILAESAYAVSEALSYTHATQGSVHGRILACPRDGFLGSWIHGLLTIYSLRSPEDLITAIRSPLGRLIVWALRWTRSAEAAVLLPPASSLLPCAGGVAG
jgi:hypothetical protein